MEKILLPLILTIIVSTGYSQIYPDNEDGLYQDMLTPEYYNTPDGGAFREAVNKFIHFARIIPFQHPFENASGQIPAFTVNRDFGDGIGPGGAGSHHPARDCYVGNSTSVNMYAAHDGIVNISREVPRYRHYLSITKDISDSLGHVLGRVVTLYAHIDLDLDSLDNLNLDGQYVNKGDLISKHLYSETMGGPHLHFEIRYYQPTDSGVEDFYGGNVGGNTSPSSGSWTYGFWNPDHGYGFANPDNHLNQIPSGIISNDFEKGISSYPNPTTDKITIELKETYQKLDCSIYNSNGIKVGQKEFGQTNLLRLDLSHFNSGIYILKLTVEGDYGETVIRILKE